MAYFYALISLLVALEIKASLVVPLPQEWCLLVCYLTTIENIQNGTNTQKIV